MWTCNSLPGKISVVRYYPLISGRYIMMLPIFMPDTSNLSSLLSFQIEDRSWYRFSVLFCLGKKKNTQLLALSFSLLCIFFPSFLIATLDLTCLSIFSIVWKLKLLIFTFLLLFNKIKLQHSLKHYFTCIPQIFICYVLLSSRYFLFSHHFLFDHLFM